MSDEAEDRDGTADEATGATSEQPTAAWSQPAAGPRWSEIASAADQPGSDSPTTEAGRRRPSSLRFGPAPSSEVPRRNLTPPAFPGQPAFQSSSGTAQPQPESQAPVSEPPLEGKSGHVPNSSTSPLGKLPVEKLPLDKLQALVKERPEVGVGLAFAGGLVIATILRRLAR